MALTSFCTRLPLAQNHPKLGPSRKSLALSFGSDLHGNLGTRSFRTTSYSNKASATRRFSIYTSVATVLLYNIGFLGKSECSEYCDNIDKLCEDKTDNTYRKRNHSKSRKLAYLRELTPVLQRASWYLFIPTDT